MTFVLNADIDVVFESSVAHVIKMSPELLADFECPHSKLETCNKSHQVFTTQKRWRFMRFEKWETSNVKGYYKCEKQV